MAQLQVFPVASCTTSLAALVAAFSACHLTALGHLRGFVNAMVKPGAVPCDPDWLVLSWLPNSSCWSLAVIWLPLAQEKEAGEAVLTIRGL